MSKITHVRGISAIDQGIYVGKKGAETKIVDATTKALTVPSAVLTGNITSKTTIVTVVPLSGTNAHTLDASAGDIFTLTPSTHTTITVTNASAGMQKTLAITAIATNCVLTFSTVGALVNGTLQTGTSAGKVFMMTFASPSTTLIETGRTTAL